jgi:hypothetical protein
MLASYRATGGDKSTNESLAVKPNLGCELYIVDDLLSPSPRVLEGIQYHMAQNVSLLQNLSIQRAISIPFSLAFALHY